MRTWSKASLITACKSSSAASRASLELFTDALTPPPA